jgi:hypothetical protein
MQPNHNRNELDDPSDGLSGFEDHQGTGATSIDDFVVSSKDRKLVWWVFLLLGVGFLLPWNAFISASAYFVTRTCISTESTAIPTNISTSNESNFMLWLGLLYNLSGVITLGLMLFVQRRRDSKTAYFNSFTVTNNMDEQQHGGYSQWKMIVISLSVFLFIMLLTTSMVLIPSIDPTLFQSISLSSASICGISGAFISAGIVSFANIFPSDLGIQPFVSGQAVGGVVISILNFILFGTENTGADLFWNEKCATSAYLESSPYLLSVSQARSCESYAIDWGAFAYFLAGALFIGLCIALYIHLDRSEIAKHYRILGKENLEVRELEEAHQDCLEEVAEGEHAEHLLIEPLLNTEDITEENTLGSQRADNHVPNDNSSNESQAQLVWNSIRIPAVTIFTTFLITITIFPSWTTKLESVHQCQDRSSRLSNDLFIPGFIVLFNVFDFAGRAASGFLDMSIFSGSGSKRLLLLSFARVAFLPMFLLCNAAGSKLVPAVDLFYSDWFPFSFIVIFAFSNGLVSTLSFIQAAIESPHGEGTQQIASTLLNFSVGLGLLGGSLLSFVYNFIGTREW